MVKTEEDVFCAVLAELGHRAERGEIVRRGELSTCVGEQADNVRRDQHATELSRVSRRGAPVHARVARVDRNANICSMSAHGHAYTRFKQLLIAAPSLRSWLPLTSSTAST